MATWTDRYSESGGRIRKSYIVRFKNREGRRQIATFQTPEAAQYFHQEITKKEQFWKAEQLLKELEGNG